MGKHIRNQLTSAEKTFKEKDAAWQQKMKTWEEWKAQAKERERAAAKEKRNTGRLKADLEMRTQSENPNERWENFNPNAPLDNFSFLNTKAPYSIRELQQDCKEVMLAGTPEWAVLCLRRGIGVHHSGMNKAYRALLEMHVYYSLEVGLLTPFIGCSV
jgi:ATP-dependent RNA helicase DDX60